ncbi:MAG: lipopolysaccharide biosynthesis protein [Bacteroidaceae bacterium]|nr:lipopolysaccharide biosynthesis protein [Bacteroidaceae bacterium]
MASLKSLAKDTAIYGLSSIVGRFLNYLLVPLYTYTLESCSDYGIVNDLYSQSALMLVILTFGMETTFFRFINKEEKPMEVFSTSLMMVGGVALLFLLLVLGSLSGVAGALGYAEHPQYVGIMAVIVAMDAFQAILYSFLRYQKKALRFASLKMLFILVNCALNVVAYVVVPNFLEDWPITVGYTFAINLISTSLIMLCFLPELRRCPWRFNWRYCKPMLRYTWPMLVLGIAGILNQVAGQLLLPRVLEKEAGRTALGIYGACVKIAMIMAMITQAFRYAYEPVVFAGHNDKNNPELLAKTMKFFIIFTLLAFLCVVGYMDILQHIIEEKYREGLRIVPIVMVAEIMMGIYFNLSFWYKLIDKTIYGAWFSLSGCAVLLAVNLVFIPQYGYMACAWAGVAGYATSMLLSFFVGQRKNPIPYPLGSIAGYVVVAALFYVGMVALSVRLPLVARLGVNSLLIILYLGHIIYHEKILEHLRRH